MAGAVFGFQRGALELGPEVGVWVGLRIRICREEFLGNCPAPGNRI